MTRTEKYRQIAFDNGCLAAELWIHNQCKYFESLSLERVKKETNRHLKRAIVEKNILENVIIPVNDLELLVGRLDEVHRLTKEQIEIIDNTDFSQFIEPSATHHRTLDYEKVIKYGVDHIISEVKTALANTNDKEKQDFYKAGLISLEALCTCFDNAKKAIWVKIDSCTDETRKSELRLMAENFDVIPRKPCEHFYQALQCIWLIEFCAKCISDIAVAGRIDTYLYPLYKNDIESGYITQEFANELVDQFYFKHNELYCSWPAPIMVGGTDKDGNSICNELTYMAIEAIERVNLINPSVAICCTKDTPQNLIERGVYMIAKGHTRPSFFSDEIIVEGLQKIGVSKEDSHSYIHSTCVEITPEASSNIQVATPYINLARAFEYIFTEGKCDHIIDLVPGLAPGGGGNTKEIYLDEEVEVNLDEITDFDKFYELVKKVCQKILESHAKATCEYFQKIKNSHSSPLSSMLLNDCIKRGLDCGGGGAKYNFGYPTMPGFVTLVDSVYAVKKVVFDDKVLSLRELANLCNNDFNDEKLHAYLKNKVDKFANGVDECDNIAIDLYNFIRTEIKKFDMPGTVEFSPSYFAYVYHGLMGLNTKATPDGRRSGAALSECLGATQGSDKNGVLGIIDSVSKIDHTTGVGGIATNIRFTKDFIDTEKGIKSVADFIRYSMQKGCFELQFNVVSAETLKKAKESPQDYKTLMVRVAGYSDYFVRLSPTIQEEIISRTEHGIL